MKLIFRIPEKIEILVNYLSFQFFSPNEKYVKTFALFMPLNCNLRQLNIGSINQVPSTVKFASKSAITDPTQSRIRDLESSWLFQPVFRSDLVEILNVKSTGNCFAKCLGLFNCHFQLFIRLATS